MIWLSERSQKHLNNDLTLTVSISMMVKRRA